MVEPEPVVESMLEPETEIAPESKPKPKPKAEPEPEPETVAEPEPVVEAELTSENVIEPEPDSEAKAEPGLVAETVVKPEPKAKPKAEAETVVEPKSETVVEPETVVESELGSETETEAGTVRAAQSADADDNGVLESVSEGDIAPAASENRIDFIAKEIYDLADNIRYNLGVIETISDLLSGKWHVEPEAETPDKKDEQALVDATPSFGTDTAGIRDIFRDGIATPVEFENKINYIEMKVSELADSIRHDVSVIGAISNLLSGTGITLEKAAAQVDEPEPVTDDSAPVADVSAPVADVSAPVADVSAPSDSGENKIDDAVKEFFEISESV